MARKALPRPNHQKLQVSVQKQPPKHAEQREGAPGTRSGSAQLRPVRLPMLGPPPLTRTRICGTRHGHGCSRNLKRRRRHLVGVRHKQRSWRRRQRSLDYRAPNTATAHRGRFVSEHMSRNTLVGTSCSSFLQTMRLLCSRHSRSRLRGAFWAKQQRRGKDNARHRPCSQHLGARPNRRQLLRRAVLALRSARHFPCPRRRHAAQHRRVLLPLCSARNVPSVKLSVHHDGCTRMQGGRAERETSCGATPCGAHAHFPQRHYLRHLRL